MLGIIGAMDVEVRTIKDKMTGTVTTRAAGCDFVTGELKGVMITVVQCAPVSYTHLTLPTKRIV